MTELNMDFRLGIVALGFLVYFYGWLLDQMEQAAWVQEIKSKLQGVLWGEVGRCFGTWN